MNGLDNYKKKCKNTQGGLKRVYLIKYVKYPYLDIKSEAMLLTEFPESTYFKFECSGNYSQSSETQNGAQYFNQTVSVQLPKVYREINAHNFVKHDFRVIAETNNGDLIMFGVRNGMECKISNSSGAAKADFNGFNLEFTGMEEKAGLLVLDLSILGSGNISVDYGFNYNMNFTL